MHLSTFFQEGGADEWFSAHYAFDCYFGDSQTAKKYR